ncbi:MAG TPA: NfeD family protein [Anaerolineales bacterium]
MQLPDPYVLANLLYLMLVAGIWLAALALVTPGTGVIELLAVAALAGGGAGLLLLPANGWAFAALVVGVLMFGVALTGRRPAAWLLGSAVALSAGSVFLFRVEPGGGPAVHPLLAGLTTAGTLGFFWLVIRKAAEAQRIGPVFNPAAVLGQVGEARTSLDPTGAVYVGGELWSARSAMPVVAGDRVRVTKVDGLILDVVPAEPDERAGAG